MEKSKTYTVNDLESLQKEFYRMYDPDYWLYKIMLLKNSHDEFDQLKPILTKNTEEMIDKDFQRVIRTEMHFLYFQMVETLFEIIFAISESDNRDLWMALTFSNYRDNYKKIAELDDSSKIFTTTNIGIGDDVVETPLLRWIFYFVHPSKLTDEEWKKNLENIKNLLIIFARDFKDRGEYNAYKHSLRFYNAPLSVAIGMTGSDKMQSLGSSEDCITFIEEQKKENKDGKMIPTGRIMRTQKPFDFERDYHFCILIYHMIKTIIYTRKYPLLDDLREKEFTMANFIDLEPYKVAFSKILTKASFTV